jgi:hypothetical protein
VGGYITLAAVITLVSLVVGKETKDVDYLA